MNYNVNISCYISRTFPRASSVFSQRILKFSCPLPTVWKDQRNKCLEYSCLYSWWATLSWRFRVLTHRPHETFRGVNGCFNFLQEKVCSWTEGFVVSLKGFHDCVLARNCFRFSGVVREKWLIVCWSKFDGTPFFFFLVKILLLLPFRS